MSQLSHQEILETTNNEVWTISSSLLEPHELIQLTAVPRDLTPQQCMAQSSIETPALYAKAGFILLLFLGYWALLLHRHHAPLVQLCCFPFWSEVIQDKVRGILLHSVAVLTDSVLCTVCFEMVPVCLKKLFFFQIAGIFCFCVWLIQSGLGFFLTLTPCLCL